jgi:hypothetical protein
MYPVKLRVTDTNGLTDEDTINVQVYGASTIIQGVVPSEGRRGHTVPVVITGGNFKHVTAEHVHVSGNGVMVVGTAISDAMGTTLTGLSYAISTTAPLGARNVTISNFDGTYTAVDAFTVLPRQPAPTPVAIDPQVFPE